MRCITTTALFALILSAGLLAGCCNTDGGFCCTQGDPVASTQAACRDGTSCIWPPERTTLDRGEVQLTPSLNKALGCPGFDSGYRYSKAPFECREVDRRYQAGSQR